MRVAGIDIGTLTCRLLIVDITHAGSLREIDSDRRILRLGEGVDQSCVLTSDAMGRVVDTLGEWQKTIASHQVGATVVVATSAVREAKNRQDFLSLVKEKTGIEVEVLSGEEEARRTLLGIKFGLPSEIHSILGLDIGGGSTEFIRANRDIPPLVASLDVGVVRISERCLHTDPPTKKEVIGAEHLIRNELEKISWVWKDVTGATLVGTAGTVTTLAAMAQQLPHYEPARIHNYWLSLETIGKLEENLGSRTKAERVHLPGLEGGREGVILAGTIILRTVMEMLSFKRCLVSDYGLREGIIVNLLKRNII